MAAEELPSVCIIHGDDPFAIRRHVDEAFDTVEVRRRVFLTLSAGDDFLILSNAYARFPELASALLARVPNQIVSEETRTMAAAPPAKNGDIVSCWIATAVMIGIIVIQLGRPH